jgi:15-cis-phytoene synthase
LRHFDSLGPDRVIALAYAPKALRDDFEALLLLDGALANALRGARDPMLGQIRLAWWREQLSLSHTAAVSSDPALQAIRFLTSRHDVNEDRITDLVNGWETLLGEWPLSDEALTRYAQDRGAALFTLAADCAGIASDDSIRAGGAAWALDDLACHCSDQDMAARAHQLAARITVRFPKALRPFGLLAHFVRADASKPPALRIRPGSPRRMLQAIGFVYLRR